MTLAQKDPAATGVVVACAVVTGAGVAAAADAVPIESDAYDWSGVYIGGAAGMILGGEFPVGFDPDYDADEDFIYGGFIGMNHQMGDFVVGMEIAVQSGFDGVGEDSDTDEYDVNYIVDGKAKVGLAIDPVLLYAFGGPSWVDAWIEHPDADYGFSGVNFGLGVDWMVIEHLSLGAEIMGRTVFDATGTGGNHAEDHTHWQGMLRMAFHL